MENTNKEIGLINGTFSPNEAKELLLNLYTYKINFHELKNFSSNERLNKDDELIFEKISKLKQSKQIVMDIIQEAIDKNQELIITSTISIEFKNS